MNVVIIVVVIVAISALVLRAMGRPWVSSRSGFSVWHGDANSSETSQALFDPYSLTHVTHGLLLYLATSGNLAASVSVEAAWEILENTPWVVNRYRASALTQGYEGDSITNSGGDLLAMLAGFGIARAIQNPWAILAVSGVLEIVAYATFRDSVFVSGMSLVVPKK